MRRRFTPEYKLHILAGADAGKRGELERCYVERNSAAIKLSAWRWEYGEHGVSGLSKRTPKQRRNEPLRKESSRLKRKLEIANDCLESQKPCRCSIVCTMGAIMSTILEQRPERLPMSRACEAVFPAN